MDFLGNLITDEVVAPSITFIYAHEVLGTFQEGQELQVKTMPLCIQATLKNS